MFCNGVSANTAGHQVYSCVHHRITMAGVSFLVVRVNWVLLQLLCNTICRV